MFAQKLLKIVLFVMMGSGAFSFLAWIGLLAASRKIKDSGVIDKRRLKEATRAAFPGIVSSGLLGLLGYILLRNGLLGFARPSIVLFLVTTVSLATLFLLRKLLGIPKTKICL